MKEKREARGESRDEIESDKRGERGRKEKGEEKQEKWLTGMDG